MKPRYFFARLDVWTEGSREQGGRRLMVEVEVDAAEIDVTLQELSQAILEVAVEQGARHPFDSELEYVADFELIPTNVIPRTWKEPVPTSIPGVTIWGATLH